MMLVKGIRPERNSYRHKNNVITWKGVDGARRFENRTDCSGFLNILLQQAHGFTPEYYQQWLNTRRPLARTYHDTIVRKHGFTRIEQLDATRSGDVIAIKYNNAQKGDNTGHLLLVVKTPKKRLPSAPLQEDTQQWEVVAIDSSRSGHGKNDTRRRPNGTFGSGVGQGVIRLYSDLGGEIVGYTWSTFLNSEFFPQSNRHLVIGRLDLQFHQLGKSR